MKTFQYGNETGKVIAFLSIFLAFISGSHVIAQRQFNVTFDTKSQTGQKFYLMNYYFDKRNKIDSSLTNEKGQLVFRMDDYDKPGIYRIESGGKGIDFIFNKEDVKIAITPTFRLDSVKVIKSEENKILFEYMLRRIEYDRRIELLEPLLQYYPSEDTFYNDIEEKVTRTKTEFTDFLDRIDKSDREMLVSHVIRFDQLDKIRPDEFTPEHREYLKSHYFDNADLTDTLMLNTPILPDKVISYLSLFLKSGASKDQQELNFITGVDSLMKFTHDSQAMKEALVNYLIEGFQAYGFEKVLTHLVESYVFGQSCVSDQEESKLKKRIEGFKLLAVGNKAPDFETVDMTGRPIRLSATEKSYRLLIFWSTNCLHCVSLMPGLIKLYNDFKGKVDIIGISVDTDEDTWRKFITEQGLNWTQIAELKGWDGKIIQDYYIYATPTFLLVDKDLTILSKPLGIGDLREALGGLK